jgi:FtsP/CotA-like multicopper oxidase with cupredoxin domain
VIPIAAFPLLAAGLSAQLVANTLPRLPLPKPVVGAARAVANDNTSPAGTLSTGVRSVALDIVEAGWHPEGDTNPQVRILAFAEAGRAPLVPGPMVRVRVGTRDRLALRNRTDSALVISGLRPGSAGTDTVHMARGASRTVEYVLDAPGTYFYWGALPGNGFDDRLWLDSQLNGAIVVDPPGGSPPDRVLLISEWFHPYEDRPFEVVSVINGAAWPHTERLVLQQGDSTRFRVINTIPLFHPMHLHGFYFRVVSRGTGLRDEAIEPAMQPLVNTDLMAPGGTLTLAFLPTTPGNWLFHCHFSFHMDESVTLTGSPRVSAEVSTPHEAHGRAGHAMHGLVMGIRVLPSPDYAEPSPATVRDMRLLVQARPRALVADRPAYGFALQRGPEPPAPDSVELPGVIELRRGEPVRVNVVNRLAEPTGIHWHGLEIESFPDGVPDWSGMNDRIFRPIAPRDSFYAEFTPPRSGTFPVHSHLNERHQIQSGLYGAILVTDGPRDLVRDHLVVAGGGGPEIQPKIESPFALVNGRRSPPPLRLVVGEEHRLRIVSIHPDWRVAFTLRDDSTVARWRAIAKDGHDLPPAQATVRPAHVIMGPGETADFLFRPTEPGTWTLEVRSAESGWYIPLSVIVDPPAGPPARP